MEMQEKPYLLHLMFICRRKGLFMLYKVSVTLMLSLFVVNLNAQTNSSSSASLPLKPRVTVEDSRYHKCANTCEDIWRKWDNVTNKELCQQQCLMSVMEEIRKQNPEKEEVLNQDSENE